MFVAMARYRSRSRHVSEIDATLDEVWAYIDSREAQVELDPRISRVDVIEGVWGEPGSRMVVTARLPDGQIHTAESVLESVDAPHGYVTSHTFPDGVTRASHQFREIDGGVEWVHEVEIVTRDLSWIERFALRASERKRRIDAARGHELDREAMQHCLDAMRTT